MSSKEPRPLPTPQWSILCDEARGRPRCLIVDKDANEVAAVNPYREAWNENSELIAQAPELLADNARLSDQLKRTQYRLHAISEKANRIQRAWREYRSVAGVADKIQIDTLKSDLADHKQLLRTKNEQLDTMTQCNRRLRELLRRAAPFVPVENPLTPELRNELDK